MSARHLAFLGLRLLGLWFFFSGATWLSTWSSHLHTWQHSEDEFQFGILVLLSQGPVLMTLGVTLWALAKRLSSHVCDPIVHDRPSGLSPAWGPALGVAMAWFVLAMSVWFLVAAADAWAAGDAGSWLDLVAPAVAAVAAVSVICSRGFAFVPEEDL